MRLIDADKLTEQIDKNEKLPWNLDKISQVAFKSCVKAQPTAYNVEEVVKKLEVLKMRHYLAMANKGSGALDFAYIHVGSAIDKAIEIVRKGGAKNE